MRILLIIGLLLFSYNPVAAGQTFNEIMTAPADSIERENLRIWVPIERRSKCWLTIEIIGHDKKVTRHLIDALIGPGYYNFYWNKRDDSGAFVDSGIYEYEINDFGKKKKGQVKVSYADIRIEILSSLGLFSKEIQASSAHLEIEWLSESDSLPETLIDTTLITGHHKFNLPDHSPEDFDDYIQLIRIDGKVVERAISRIILRNE